MSRESRDEANKRLIRLVLKSSEGKGGTSKVLWQIVFKRATSLVKEQEAKSN